MKTKLTIAASIALLLLAIWAAQEPAAKSVSINLCRTDAELAKLPKDHMSQQRCREPLPIGG